MAQSGRAGYRRRPGACQSDGAGKGRGPGWASTKSPGAILDGAERRACKAEAQDGPAQNRLERFWTARSAGLQGRGPGWVSTKSPGAILDGAERRACKAEAQDGSAQNRLERFWTARSAGPARPRPRMGRAMVAWSDFGRRGAPGLQGRGPGWAEQW